MQPTNSRTEQRSKSMLEYLMSLQQQNKDLDLSVSDDLRHGTIHIRGGVVQSAHSGILHGNGALLTLARMEDPTIEEESSTVPVQKTVYISLAQIDRLVSQTKNQQPVSPPADDESMLEEAKLLFFQYRYKQAGEKLVRILRANRFFYPAWLWQSRLIGRQDYIGKALDEAYRWGNHDQDIWREARKIRPQLDNNSTIPAKRCFFCWSVLQQFNSCDHCNCSLTITNRPQLAEPKKDELQYALTMFSQALRHEPNNARVAYSLAIGYFNLKEYEKSLDSLRIAAQLAPQTALYRKSLALLNSITQKEKKKASAMEVSAVQPSASEKKILIIEDSQTSRKVLAMLFSRCGYQILEAANGASALIAGKENQPDCILLDVMLPDTNGHDLLPKLREIEHLSKIPAIMITGKHDSGDKILGLRSGADEYVTKPFNPEKLIAIVRRYIDPESIRQQSPAPAIQTARTKAPTQSSTTRIKPAAARQESRQAQPAAKPVKGDKSIFVIEDSHTSRKVLSMILGRKGYHIYEAASGREALSLAQKIQPDLVLLDVMLPDITGYKILPQLKTLEHFTKLPVIMLTGKSGPTDRMKGMLAGSNEYVTKPFNPEKLLAMIGRYI